MWIKTWSLCLVLFGVSTIVGCGSDDNKSTSQAVATEIEGTWDGGCVDDSDGESATIEMVVSGSKMDSKMTLFSTTGCVTSDAYLSFNVVENFVIEGDGAATGTKNYYSTKSSFKVTPHTDALVSAFNSESYCGVTWTKNVASDITGKTCGDEGDLETSTTQKYYGSYLLDGTSLNLAVSDEGEHDASTAAKRAIDVSSSTPFTKK